MQESCFFVRIPLESLSGFFWNPCPLSIGIRVRIPLECAEDKAISGDTTRANIGLCLGFVLCVAFLGASYLLVRDGHELAGSILGGVDIVSLAGVFVYGTASRARERENKYAKRKQ